MSKKAKKAKAKDKPKPKPKPAAAPPEPMPSSDASDAPASEPDQQSDDEDSEGDEAEDDEAADESDGEELEDGEGVDGSEDEDSEHDGFLERAADAVDDTPAPAVGQAESEWLTISDVADAIDRHAAKSHGLTADREMFEKVSAWLRRLNLRTFQIDSALASNG